MSVILPIREFAHRFPGYDPARLPVDCARRIIRAFVEPIGETERVALRDALGRVLAADLVSPIDVPGCDNSAMDGWAVRGADLDAGAAVTLREIGASFAGAPFAGTVEPGQCVRIMTGAAIPRGADTVIEYELARAENGRITVAPGQRPGKNRRFAGEDVRRGQIALAAGTLIRPAELGMIASLGLPQASVHRRPRVAFFSTGDELRAVDAARDAASAAPQAFGLYDSNRHALWGMLARLGCETLDLGVVRDDPRALEAAFHEAAAADAVVTTGGVSESEADFTRQVLGRIADSVFWGLAMRPGRPFGFGRLRNPRAPGSGAAYLFALPGNPVAAMVAFYQLVRGGLLALAGCGNTEPPVLHAKAGEAIAKKPGRTEFMRARLEHAAGERVVRLTGPQGSGMLRSMGEADCLLVLREAQSGVEAGEWVEVIPMEGLA